MSKIDIFKKCIENGEYNKLDTLIKGSYITYTEQRYFINYALKNDNPQVMTLFNDGEDFMKEIIEHKAYKVFENYFINLFDDILTWYYGRGETLIEYLVRENKNEFVIKLCKLYIEKCGLSEMNFDEYVLKHVVYYDNAELLEWIIKNVNPHSEYFDGKYNSTVLNRELMPYIKDKKMLKLIMDNYYITRSNILHNSLRNSKIWLDDGKMYKFIKHLYSDNEDDNIKYFTSDIFYKEDIVNYSFNLIEIAKKDGMHKFAEHLEKNIN